LKDVSFSYPNSKRLALNGLSLDVKRGQTLALVGLSGGGKTTVLALIERFYDVIGGSIVSSFKIMGNKNK
jgi:subfamily B ATP-binding cassette protein MsbA